MPLVKSLAELTIRTTIGHMIHVLPDTPTYIPPEVLPYALQQGCVECKDSGEVVLQQPKAPKPKVPTGEVPQLSVEDQQDPKRRAYVLKLALTKLYADNNTEDFTVADNRPKVSAVTRVVGFPVTGNELATALDLFSNE